MILLKRACPLGKCVFLFNKKYFGLNPSLNKNYERIKFDILYTQKCTLSAAIRNIQ